jgi:tetratricopeptide (TPR) repeat protein
MGICRLSSITLLFIWSTLCSVAQTAAPEGSAVDREIQSGTASIRQGNYAEAKQHFEKAENMGGPPSAEINSGIAVAELEMDHFDAVRQREAKVLELVSTDRDRAEAYNLIGTSWLREAAQSTANLGMLKSAEESFQRAAKLDPLFDTAYFNLGIALLRQKRDDDAAAAFKNFIAAAEKNPAYEQNLPITPQSPAPAFKVTDTEGHLFSSDSLRGRFVLLDFWATWCAPCMRALPAMRQLAHYFPPSQFTLVSVSENTGDQQVWKQFIALHKMDWTQLWDNNLELYYKFGLEPRPHINIPRYVLIDGNGFVRRVYSGTDHFGFVIGQVAKTVAAAPQTTPKTTPKTTPQQANSSSQLAPEKPKPQ